MTHFFSQEVSHFGTLLMNQIHIYARVIDLRMVFK